MAPRKQRFIEKVLTMEFAPKNWKRSTLRSILTTAYKICFTKELLDQELKRIERGFIEINGYPKWIDNQLKEEC